MQNERAACSKRNRRKLVEDYKAAHPCVDCGEADPICLDFDHPNDVEKVMSVAVMVSTGQSLPKLLAEMRKCVIRCSNCHRKRHRNERSRR